MKAAEFHQEFSVFAKTATADIIINTPGWSGKVIRRDAPDIEDRSFLLSVRESVRNFDGGQNSEGQGSGGYVDFNAAGGIVAISLEHFGSYPNEPTASNAGVQALGRDSDGYTGIPAWGANINDNALSITDDAIHIKEYKYRSGTDPEATQTNYAIKNVGNGNYFAFNLPCRIYGNWGAHSTTNIVTDLPIFRTDAELLTWINSNFEDTSNMINNITPADEYATWDNCWYVQNVFGHNTKDRANYTDYRNYQFWPKTGRICFYRSKATASDPYQLKLLSYTGYDKYKAGAWDTDYKEYSGSIESNYMNKSVMFADDDYYTVFCSAEANTNIPIFDTLSQATDYINYLIDIDQASNYADLAQAQNDIVKPTFGVEDTETDIGANEQAYNIAGFHLYEVGHTELSSFFLEIFNTDPNVVDAIIEGTRLFSGNEINAIMMCMYLPISDISKICTMGSTSKITVGTWTADHSEGTRIAKNDVIMNMGTMFIPYRYNSEQDFEPYTQIFIQLPYCGTHQLQVSKYIGKTIRCDYAVCVADGSCKAMLFGNDILLDEFPGNMGSMRPITAADAAQYVSNIVNGVMDMIPTAGSIANAATGAVGASSAGGIAGAMAGGYAATANGIWKGYELLQAAENPPMSTSGSLSGGISYFGVQKPHFIIAQKEVVRPLNERQIIGYPSGQGGKVGTFSGYLKCSAFNLADGFTGTQQEHNEIYEIMSKGIYL